MTILSENATDFIKSNYFNTIDIIMKKKDEYSDLMGLLQAIILFPVDIDYFYDVMIDVSDKMNILFGMSQNNIANRYIDLHFALASVFSFRARCSDLYNDLRKISNDFKSGQVSQKTIDKAKRRNKFVVILGKRER